MWLYRYVIRGLSVVFIAGLITILSLAIYSQLVHPHSGRRGPADRGGSLSPAPSLSTHAGDSHSGRLP